MSATALRFNGADYQPERDNPRLGPQLERVLRLMQDGQWRTLDGIAQATGDPVASVSAQLRHLRKPRFGSYVVEREHRGAGLYVYRVLPPEPVLRLFPVPSDPTKAPATEMSRPGALTRKKEVPDEFTA